MIKMKRLRHIIMVTTIVVCGCTSVPTGENCALQAPPKEAYPEYIDGMFFFTYPKNLSDYYTGCWITWYENGDKAIIIYFNDGVPSKAEGYMGRLLLTSCVIEEKKKNIDVTKLKCMSYEDVDSRVKRFREAKPFERAIPSDRDPRR